MSPEPYDAVDVSPPVAGIVVEEGRGALPFHLIHGESLVAAAAWAAGEAGASLGFATARLFDQLDPTEKAKDAALAAKGVSGARGQMTALKKVQPEAIDPP